MMLRQPKAISLYYRIRINDDIFHDFEKVWERIYLKDATEAINDVVKIIHEH